MTNQAARKLGKLGGIARAKKYSKEQLSKWAKLGGRPKKIWKNEEEELKNYLKN